MLDILFALKTASDVCYSVVIYSTLYSYVLYYTVIRCLSSMSFLVFLFCVCVHERVCSFCVFPSNNGSLCAML